MINLSNYTYDEIQLGQTARITHQITNNDIINFAVISGDVNPAHLDPEYAAKTPFKKIIAHGMLNGAFISTILGTVLPGPGTIYLSQELKFVKPVFVNDVLEVAVEVVEKLAENQIKLACSCINQSGEIVSTGLAKVLAPLSKLKLKMPKLTVSNIRER